MQNVLIQTCNLDDGAVTADKIDFTTFDTGWKKMTLPSGMSDSLSLTGGLWYRVVNGIVHLYGQIRKASGNFSSGETLAVFPNEAMPYSTATTDSEPFIGAVAGGVIVRTSIQNSDNKLIYNAGTSTSWIFYELSYKAKTS